MVVAVCALWYSTLTFGSTYRHSFGMGEAKLKMKIVGSSEMLTIFAPECMVSHALRLKFLAFACRVLNTLRRKTL